MTAEDYARGVDPDGSAARPSTVETPRGLTVLYRDRCLYSRHDPAKNPKEAAEAAIMAEETLVLCPSPILGYGLDVILRKLPAASFVLALEADENLMALSAERIPRDILANPSFALIRTSSIARVLETVDALTAGPFRRCVRIDLSGGSSLHRDFYGAAHEAIVEYIGRWWRNRVTLMKLGRNYARNFFSNAHGLESSFAIPERLISRPIVVAGAGPSLDSSLPFIAENRERVYLLAVDAALPTLRDAGMVPDAVVIVESQYWITRAFIGFRGSGIPVFADLTANPQAVLATGGPVAFFHTAYARARFLSRFSDLGIPLPVMDPLGSVGLSALDLALLVASGGYPILFTGLDFSWGPGLTHSVGAPHARDSFEKTGRLVPLERFALNDSDHVARVPGKGGKPMRTDPALSLYAALCAARFSGHDRVLDIGTTGIDTGCGRVTLDEARAILDGHPCGAIPRPVSLRADWNAIRAYIASERDRLLAIRGILTGETDRERDRSDSDSNGALGLIAEADYLFLHFPDGHRGAMENDAFLRRVRIELEYFLKSIDHSRAGYGRGSF